MKWPGFIHNRLAAKLFLSYLIVLAVGIVVLRLGTQVALPQAFQRHLGRMAGAPGQAGSQRQLLYADFQAGVSDAILWAGTAAFVTASLISLIVSRQVVQPVGRMMRASRRIADGHYDERVGKTAGGDELGQLAESFDRMAAKLESTEAMRRQLIGDVAHELRTPLSSVKGYMEALIDGALPPEPETYQRVYAEANRMQRLVQSLQELSRIEAGVYDLNLEPLGVHAAIEDALGHLERQYTEKGVSASLRTAPGLPQVLADHDRLEQVLLNLLGNALQYTPEGGSVTVQARANGSEVLITVADTGIGLAPEHLAHVFDRFFRADRSRSRASGGSGIGLTVAKHLVEAQGGHIWVESAGLGQGSTFAFTVPVAE
jgi:signal transduction histidine kinase